MKITFVTGNKRKIAEAKLACEPEGIEIATKKLEIIEVQAVDAESLVKHKAEEAFEVLQKPVVVTDTFWRIPALNGFPGAYMKYVAEWFTPQDFLALLKDKSDRSAFFSENIGYMDGEGFKFFSKEFEGRIVDSPRGSGISLEQVAEFNGYTLGERRDQGSTSHTAQDYVWNDFARWFKANKQ